MENTALLEEKFDYIFFTGSTDGGPPGDGKGCAPPYARHA